MTLKIAFEEGKTYYCLTDYFTFHFYVIGRTKKLVMFRINDELYTRKISTRKGIEYTKPFGGSLKVPVLSAENVC